MKLTYRSYRTGKRSQQKEDLLPPDINCIKILINFLFSTLLGNLLTSAVS